MSDIKKSEVTSNQQDLKKADDKKTQSNIPQSIVHAAEIRKRHQRMINDNGSDVKVKRKLPLGIDIVAGIVMLLIVCAIIVGSYMLFRYYSNDYDTVDVTYTVAFSTTEDLDQYSIKDKEVFVDTGKGTVYFGRVTNVRSVKNENGLNGGSVTMDINVNAKYRREEGYSLGDDKLAVGSVFKLRCVEKKIDVTVIEIVPGGK